MKNIKISLWIMGISLAGWLTVVGSDEMVDIKLPAPRTEGGMPLMQALRERQSIRAYSETPIPDQVLADLLWAAFGINRPDSGRRTAPSARNVQETEIYVVRKDGAFCYDARANCLTAVVKEDIRALTGMQSYAHTAPLNLVFVADESKMQDMPAEHRLLMLGADTGFISQNVYLFCASEGLATVIRGSVDRDALAKALNLSANKMIILVQSVGYPASENP